MKSAAPQPFRTWSRSLISASLAGLLCLPGLHCGDSRDPDGADTNPAPLVVHFVSDSVTFDNTDSLVFVAVSLSRPSTGPVTVMYTLWLAGATSSYWTGSIVVRPGQTVDSIMLSGAGGGQHASVIARIEGATGAGIGTQATCVVAISDGHRLRGFRIGSEMAGWSADTSRQYVKGYLEFDPPGLRLLIDGGANIYLHGGLVRGFAQDLSGPDTRSAQCLVMDLGSPENSLTMLTAKREAGVPVPVAQYPDSTCFVLSSIDGGVLFLRLGRFYFEVAIGGVSAGEETANVAALFVTTYSGMRSN